MIANAPQYKTGRKESLNYFLPRIESSLFHTPAVKAAVDRMLSLTRQRGETPSWDSLTSDPVLDEEYRAALKRYDGSEVGKPNATKCEEMYQTLVAYKNLRLLHELETTINKGLNAGSADPEELAEQAQALLSKMTGVVSEETELWHYGEGNNTAELHEKELAREKPNLIPTGFKSFDSINGGFPENGLMILAAFTSSLKSGMANQLILNWYYKLNINVAKVSLEMTAEQENRRLIANVAGLPLQNVVQAKMSDQQKELYAKVAKAHTDHGKKNGCRLSMFVPKREVSLTDVLTVLKPYGYKVIVIDYITLLKGSDGEQQWLELSRIAREAKIWGDNNHCLVILLAQLDEDNKIRYSRSIKEHADGVWTWSLTDADREAGQFSIKQVKGRDQELMSFEVAVDFSCLRITDLMQSKGLDEDDEDVRAYADPKQSDDDGFGGNGLGLGDLQDPSML